MRAWHPGFPNNWRLFATLTEVTFAAAAAWANGGFDVLVDTVFERADCLDLARAVFAGHTWHMVAVTCAVEILEARERARGDRRRGQAAGQVDPGFPGCQS